MRKILRTAQREGERAVGGAKIAHTIVKQITFLRKMLRQDKNRSKANKKKTSSISTDFYSDATGQSNCTVAIQRNANSANKKAARNFEFAMRTIVVFSRIHFLDNVFAPYLNGWNRFTNNNNSNWERTRKKTKRSTYKAGQIILKRGEKEVSKKPCKIAWEV